MWHTDNIGGWGCCFIFFRGRNMPTHGGVADVAVVVVVGHGEGYFRLTVIFWADLWVVFWAH
jgi:hypothetical protein